MKKPIRFLTILVGLTILSSCENSSIPRPQGYFRIDLPEKKYHQLDSISFPFQFEIPQYASINLERTAQNPNFLNLDFKRFGARVHLSYAPVDTNLAQLLEDSRSLVYKHVVKAQDIQESQIINPEEAVFGMYYQIEGNAASSSQFYLTDSTNHFLRGALYFNTEPNYDSIAPVQNFIKADIEQMIESFKWVYKPKHLSK
jgi:gliding motility-associated lipoprotein GldD